MTEHTNRAATAAAVFAALFAAHQVADHWIQTDHQAATKGKDGARGWAANLAHVATYTATAALAVEAVNRRCGLRLNRRRLALALAVSAGTHAFADRRHTLAWLAARTPARGFYGVTGGGINGAYLLDQSWHIGWLYVAALVVA